MQKFVNSFFQLLTSNQQKSIHTLLEEARLSKVDLANLINQLQTLDLSSNISLVLQESEGPSNALAMYNNVRDLQRVFELIYTASNDVSQILNATASILGYEIRSLQKEISDMKKLADNYGFLLADSRLYQTGYLESFSDDKGRDTLIADVPDRTGVNFNVTEQASVDLQQGILTLPSTLSVSHTYKATFVKSNATAAITSNVGIENVANDSSLGWRVSATSTTPITSSLPEVEVSSGFQVIFRGDLSNPAPVSQIKIIPLSDHGVEISQVFLYSTSSDNSATPILSTAIKIDEPYSITFPLQMIAAFTINFTQKTYTRSSSLNASEAQFRSVFDRVTALLDTGQIDPQVLPVFEESTVGLTNAQNSVSVGPLAVNRFLEGANIEEDYWNQLDPLATKLLDFFSYNSEIGNLSDVKLRDNMMLSDSGSVYTPGDLAKQGDVYSYDYNIGISQISIGTTLAGNRGVFVSQPLPANGEIGELKLKASSGQVLDSSFRDISEVTSIEYSVSQESQPVHEVDWLPILPTGENYIIGERLFFDLTGYGSLRFKADASQDISLFRNGQLIANDLIILMKDPSQLRVVGLRIGSQTLSGGDIYTCSYTPYGDCSIVNFDGNRIVPPRLIPAHDEFGLGEPFVTTTQRNTITLLHEPYLSQQLAASSTYSKTNGSTYQPISVNIGSDIAINLTNYSSSLQAPLDISSKFYQYLQSGSQLIFNKPITQSFRVFYDYLEKDVRVRVILRLNSLNYATPRVDYYYIKYKTKIPGLIQ